MTTQQHRSKSEGCHKPQRKQSCPRARAELDGYRGATREKQLKSWQGSWKLNLIGRTNPDWTDLSDHLPL